MAGGGVVSAVEVWEELGRIVEWLKSLEARISALESRVNNGGVGS